MNLLILNENESNYHTNDSLKIKTKTSQMLNDTPNKIDNFTKRITTRKIIRKANNIFNIRNNFKDKMDNNNNHNLTLNNKNNFFYSITTSNKANNEIKNSHDSFNNNLKSNINIKKSNINYERYKNQNLRYYPDINQEKDYQINKKEKDEKNNNTKVYTSLVNKPGKYEKIKRIENVNLPLSSSVGIIYTKKNKIK